MIRPTATDVLALVGCGVVTVVGCVQGSALGFGVALLASIVGGFVLGSLLYDGS